MLGRKVWRVSQWYKLCQDRELTGCLATLQLVTREGQLTAGFGELQVLGRVVTLSPLVGNRVPG